MENQEETFSLRPATEDDIPTISEIEKRAHKAPWAEGHFREELEKPYAHFLVLSDDETDSKIAGYIVYWIMFEECQILDVVVDLPYRGRGYAKLMIRNAVTTALNKDIRKILLDVRKSNLPAIQLYQNMKFVITHVRKSFYSDGEDAYQMALFLDQPADEDIEF
ncbi:MAG TPA: ribosomal-protein-alanine N-acetyltransferase [Bdellovibrionales bacterium]|nr:MAG: ribosomal-protein-alanine N-acetyltransferase [Bdellovibrionales bacterium GWB1_52_6]OFZ06293.1 MAG: ribosomal-protein-alanine N-acetyltransferase [Bdellovibrionales bacterium GWA1_52_35]OFZ36137.1 MAG: ribosomal-protein-alanine N-acetyltransferase [Bdellovibrionales bacterium GWC1_52_8]HAR42060.1 ribosomal-protein-alanine N-acetyltransferase [Bdellovibrionales bacterium]HCM40042.1 ribosomal-protein-alanine N-acetyltransferase [Bdellovibrionales bacterium]